MRTVTYAICWSACLLSTLVLTVPSSFADLRPISSRSPEFKQKYAPRIALVESVESMNTIKVRRLALEEATKSPQFDEKGDFTFQPQVEVIQITGFATPQELKQANHRTNPFLTQQELKRYLHFVPMIENHLRVYLLEHEVLLEPVEGKSSFRITLARGSRSKEMPKDKHYLFSDVDSYLMNDGYLLPQVSRWKLIAPKQEFYLQPDDILYFRQAKTQKNGVWHEPVLEPEKFPRPELLVPLNDTNCNLSHLNLKWMPQVAFILECADEASVQLAIGNSGEINWHLTKLLESMTKDQLRHPDVLETLESKLLTKLEENVDLKDKLQIKHLHFSQFLVE